MKNNKIAVELIKIAKELMSKNEKLDNKIKKKLNDICYSFSTGKGNNNEYYSSIPLNDIFNEFKKNGVCPVQEDGTEWSGFLSGKEGNAQIELADYKNSEIGNVFDDVSLNISYFKMGSGKFELNCYLG